MKARLALVILFLVALCLPAATPVGVAPVAAAPGWLDRFNAIRAAAGLAPVTEQASLSSDAAKHVNYMLLNPGEFEHSENPALPGYSPEGDRSARESNLARTTGSFTAEETIDGWMGSLGHRYGMLRPELRNTGHALGCNNQGCAAVLDVINGLQNSNVAPETVVYPGDGQQNVTTNLISWQFRPFGPDEELIEATLRDGAGNAVPFTPQGNDLSGDTNNYFNFVAIKANQPFAPGVTYTVTMRVSHGGVIQERAWSFTAAGGSAAACAGFSDVNDDNPACVAIAALSSQGIINGYATNPPTFGPDDAVQRAQIAAFLVRALGWHGGPTTPRSFTDFGALVTELRASSLILANRCDPQGNCVAKGYEPASCAARGKAAPCFGPNDAVSYAQVISFIARAFQFADAYGWQAQPNGALPYSGIPAVHQADARMYHFYAGTIPAAPSGSDWNKPAPRAWVARALHQALQATP